MTRRGTNMLLFAVAFLLIAGVLLIGPTWGLMPAPKPALPASALAMGLLLMLLSVLDTGEQPKEPPSID